MGENIIKLGEWFQEQREKRGESIRQQAETLDIPLCAISHFSHGRRPFTNKMVERVIKGYNLKGDELREFLIATLTDEDLQKAKQIQSSNMTVEDIAVMMKYGK